MSEAETFGFTVRQYKDGLWQVSLPHQCDEWEITPSWRGDEYGAAVAALRAFIAEALLALTALEDRKELNR